MSTSIEKYMLFAVPDHYTMSKIWKVKVNVNMQSNSEVMADELANTASLSGVLRSQKGTKLLHTSGACPGDGSYYY